MRNLGKKNKNIILLTDYHGVRQKSRLEQW